MIINIDSKNENIVERVWINQLIVKPGINLLFGGNGAGKTTTLNTIASKAQYHGDDYLNLHSVKVKIIKDDGKPFDGLVFYFSNSEHNLKYLNKKEISSIYEFDKFLHLSSLSEGMSLSQTIDDFFEGLKTNVQEGSLILMDEIDSGLDAYACHLTINKLFDILEKINKKVYVLMSFNQYEIARTYAKHCSSKAKWINMYTGKLESIPRNYKSYFNKLQKYKKKYKK